MTTTRGSKVQNVRGDSSALLRSLRAAAEVHASCLSRSCSSGWSRTVSRSSARTAAHSLTFTRTNALVQQHCEPPPPDRLVGEDPQQIVAGGGKGDGRVGPSVAVLHDLELVVREGHSSGALVQVPLQPDERGRSVVIASVSVAPPSSADAVVGRPDHQRQRCADGGRQWSLRCVARAGVLLAVFWGLSGFPKDIC